LFTKIFEGNTASSSFVNFSFGRSRFLCRYERARSHIPMLRFGMRAPGQRALALRSVGMTEGWEYGWAPYRWVWEYAFQLRLATVRHTAQISSGSDENVGYSNSGFALELPASSETSTQKHFAADLRLW